MKVPTTRGGGGLEKPRDIPLVKRRPKKDDDKSKMERVQMVLSMMMVPKTENLKATTVEDRTRVTPKNGETL